MPEGFLSTGALFLGIILIIASIFLAALQCYRTALGGALSGAIIPFLGYVYGEVRVQTFNTPYVRAAACLAVGILLCAFFVFKLETRERHEKENAHPFRDDFNNRAARS